MSFSSKRETIVEIDCLHTGGVVNIDICFIQLRAILRLLGIGVADSASTSILLRIFFILSLSFTQNLCSSSITKTHKSLNTIFSLNKLWVHTTKSIFQFLSFSIVSSLDFLVSKRVKTQILIGNGAKRLRAFS
jgi:hypothetical protein